jgi:alkylation response protein AidB-like acyl-CoA dehydrogenase
VSSDAVSMRRAGADALARMAAERARAALPDDVPPDLDAAVQVAHELGPWLPLPAQGDTLTLWEALASLGAVDLTVARVTEPHLDALAILREARRQGQIHEAEWSRHAPDWDDARLWQVYAAEGTERLAAAEHDAGWVLSGVKPWCSLAERASHALVTAWDGEERRLFAVALGHPEVMPAAGPTGAGQSTTWAARGLADVRSTAITFDAVPAVPIGAPGWYLTRPGFAWGGIGVAAIWYGATVALARRLLKASRSRPPDQVALLHVGAIDAALYQTRAALADAAAIADSGEVAAAETVLTTQRVRQSVADTADEVLSRVGHALGPGPLTGEEEHARRVADLTVYLRQHHAERDLVRQGEQVLAGTPGWSW